MRAFVVSAALFAAACASGKSEPQRPRISEAFTGLAAN